jgi:phage terminase Nu1 subunit (DNA packaging protein)
MRVLRTGNIIARTGKNEHFHSTKRRKKRMSFPTELTKSDVAKLISLTPQRVGQLTEAGVLKLNPRGLYVPAEVVAAYVAHREHIAAQRLGGGGSYTDARAAKMRADAALSQIELAERQRELVRTDSVLEIVVGAVTKMKTVILGWPNRLAPRLANKSASEIQDILKKEVHALLRTLSEFFLGANRDLKKPGGAAQQPENDAAEL